MLYVMQFTVSRQFVRKHFENESARIIDLGHTGHKNFNHLADARDYARRLCQEARDDKTETVYIVDGQRTLEVWIYKTNQLTCLQSYL